MAHQISRRAFLGQAASAPAAAVVNIPSQRSKQAWVIAEVNWQYNDEYTYAEGEQTLPKVYFDRQEAETECQRLCEQFFENVTPLDWEVDFEFYRDHLPEDCAEESATWEQLRKAGFPAPYRVLEMET